MLLRILNQAFNLTQRLNLISFQPYQQRLMKSEMIMNKVPEEKLIDSSFIKKVLRTPIKRRTITSQMGLWHGKQPQSGNQSCFSEKKTRRSWLPNIMHHVYKSQVLERDLRVSVTAKTLKCIRKYGTFDNYVLMCPPKQMDSLYGLYLRRLMLAKINNPEFKVINIRKVILSQPYKKFWTHKKTKKNNIPDIWYPSEIRYTDMTHLRVRSVSEYTPKEVRQHNELQELTQTYQDIPSNHPLLQRFKKNDPTQNYNMEAFFQEAADAREEWKKSLTPAQYEEWEKQQQFNVPQENLLCDAEIESNKLLKKRIRLQKKEDKLKRKQFKTKKHKQKED